MENAKVYPHYFKQLPEGTTHVDVYLVLSLYQVRNQAIGHAIKKLLCSGERGAKNYLQDLKEARDSISRAMEIESAYTPKTAHLEEIQCACERLHVSPHILAKERCVACPKGIPSGSKLVSGAYGPIWRLPEVPGAEMTSAATQIETPINSTPGKGGPG